MWRRPASSKGSKRKHAEDDEHAGAEEDGFEDSLEVALQVQVAELQVGGLPAGRQLHTVQDQDRLLLRCRPWGSAPNKRAMRWRSVPSAQRQR